MYYCGVARAMADAVGSVLTEDFGEASVRASLERRLPADDAMPFASEGDKARVAPGLLGRTHPAVTRRIGKSSNGCPHTAALPCGCRGRPRR